MLVADGLGHGPQAAEAAHAALVIFRRHAGEAPAAILAAIHAGLGHTRGGAVSVCRLDLDEKMAEFAGIGNVAGAVVAGAHTTRMVSLAGTAGHVARTIRSFTYPFRRAACCSCTPMGSGRAGRSIATRASPMRTRASSRR